MIALRRYLGGMSRSELAHLELLAEVDALVDRLNRWADDAPAWQPAEKCRALVRRLIERAASLRVRLEAPLVVATLGGTGTGKSALVNATAWGRSGADRPIAAHDHSADAGLPAGLDARNARHRPGIGRMDRRDLPALRDLVLVDCPDPDTTEEGRGERGEGRGNDNAASCSTLHVFPLPSPLSPLPSP